LTRDEPSAGELAAATLAEDWDPPVPLGGYADLPSFPAGVLPSWAEQEVLALAYFTQTPAALAASALLAVLSAAAGGRAVVRVRGSWQEPVNLFTVTALPPGARKSAVFAELTRPLLDAEQELAEQARPQVTEAATRKKIAVQRAEMAAKMASSASDDSAGKTLAAIMEARLADELPVLVLPRLVADDITPEAAASLLAEQGGRLAVLSAEGGIFATLAGRYSGGVPSLEVFLKGHAGDLLRVDRKGRPAEHIPHPALTVGLCVQPDVLRQIAGMPGFRGRGLLARILYAMPANLVGRRAVNPAPVKDSVRAAYEHAVRALVMGMAGLKEPAVLTLSPDAGALVIDAEKRLEPRLHPDTGDLGGITDWASKQVGAAVRIAGLLHLGTHMSDGLAAPVSADTMTAALKISDYYTAHALAAFDLMGADPAMAGARTALRWITRSGGRPVFTRREMHMGLTRSRFQKATDLDAPLRLLAEHGYIRSIPAVATDGPGRPPSPSYAVHPQAATESTDLRDPARIHRKERCEPQNPRKGRPG
jgi:replicative DNA helicase